MPLPLLQLMDPDPPLELDAVVVVVGEGVVTDVVPDVGAGVTVVEELPPQKGRIARV